jgi:antitoxin HicB
MAADALAVMIREQIRKGETIPAPSRPRGRRFRGIALPALQAAKVELYQAFRASGLRKADLARRLRMSKGNIDRLFELNHNSRLDQIEAALRALGKQLTIRVSDAA